MEQEKGNEKPIKTCPQTNKPTTAKHKNNEKEEEKS